MRFRPIYAVAIGQHSAVAGEVAAYEGGVEIGGGENGLGPGHGFPHVNRAPPEFFLLQPATDMADLRINRALPAIVPCGVQHELAGADPPGVMHGDRIGDGLPDALLRQPGPQTFDAVKMHQAGLRCPQDVAEKRLGPGFLPDLTRHEVDGEYLDSPPVTAHKSSMRRVVGILRAENPYFKTALL